MNPTVSSPVIESLHDFFQDNPTIKAHTTTTPNKDNNNNFTNSTNTTSTTTSTNTTSSINTTTTSAATPSLITNLMRQRHNTSPFSIYKIIRPIGDGSMGTVSEIKKRKSRMGGSARIERDRKRRWQRRQKMMEDCGAFCFGGWGGTMLGWWKERMTGGDVVEWKDREVIVGDGGVASELTSASSLSIDVPPASPDEKQREERRNTMTTVSSSSSSSHSSSYRVVYALKSIHLDRIYDYDDSFHYINELKNEIDILKTLDHPNIVRPIETYDCGMHLYMVMELCRGGDLYARDPYTEEEAVGIVRKILSAVSYMHRMNVTHRDLKYENILFENNSPNAEIKIIDFGLSKKYLPEEAVMKDHVGTIYTMAPQVLEGEYDSQVDLWSIGVITYMLLSSQLPFNGKRRNDIAKKIMACDYRFGNPRWHTEISRHGKHFVQSLLQYDPRRRLTACEAMTHPFITSRDKRSYRCCRQRHSFDNQHTTNDADNNEEMAVVNEERRLTQRRSSVAPVSMDDLCRSIRNFASYGQLKKLALMVVAYKSTAEEVKRLRKSFAQFDLQKNGMIDFDEFCLVLTAHGYRGNASFNDCPLATMFNGIDVDGTGYVKYTEFLAATIEALGVIEEERLAEAFDRLDSDDSGFISLENLRELFAGELSDDKLEDIIAEADVTHDNMISYSSFLLLWDQQYDDDSNYDI